MSILHSNKSLYESIMDVVEMWANNRSKDPRTKVGAGVYDETTGALFLGYNGFAKGVVDTSDRWERPAKYEYVIHAEENAVFKALAALGSRTSECTLFCTHKPCHRCMSKIVQVGIEHVYYKAPHDDSVITDIIADETGTVLTLWDSYLRNNVADGNNGYPF